MVNETEFNTVYKTQTQLEQQKKSGKTLDF